MDNTNTYCVYIHRNKKNGKVYIGQTKYGNSPNKRWANGKGYQENVYFYNAIQKYGWDKFEHFVLMQDLTLEQANYYEQQFIALYNSCNPEFGYNITTGGENYTVPQDILRQRRINPCFEEKIVQFDLHGNLIKVWNNQGDITENINKRAGRVGICCKEENYNMVFNNCLWRKMSQIINVENNPYLGKIPPKFREVLCFNPKNNSILTWDNPIEASKSTGIDLHNIYCGCKRDIKTVKGKDNIRYNWSYFISPVVMSYLIRYGVQQTSEINIDKIKELASFDKNYNLNFYTNNEK